MFNTLIIDAEGDEEYYIKSLKNLKNIKHLFFEHHYNIFNSEEIKKMMNLLNKSNFILKTNVLILFTLKERMSNENYWKWIVAKNLKKARLNFKDDYVIYAAGISTQK